jgi:hypothetical protein
MCTGMCITLEPGIDAMFTIVCDFREKMAFFLKKQCYNPIFAKKQYFEQMNADVSPKYSAKIFQKNHNIGPRRKMPYFISLSAM